MTRDPETPSTPDSASSAVLEGWAHIARAGVHRHYPFYSQLRLEDADDVRPHTELHPAFSGSFDWHSCVHSHWCLARVARTLPESSLAREAIAALDVSLAPDHLEAELAYLQRHPSFELPYGLAWLLALAAELRRWPAAERRGWGASISPLASLVAERLLGWAARLPVPIRSGVHSQSAFAFAMAIDAGHLLGLHDLSDGLLAESRRLYGADRAAPIDYEPSAHDFLSPALAEADLMRRALAEDEFPLWLDEFLPRGYPHAPLPCPDLSDGKLSHLAGLALSRAWMLAGIVQALPPRHPRRAEYERQFRAHRRAGLPTVDGVHYAGAHWLPTFAVYLETGGVPGGQAADRSGDDP